MVFFDCWFIEWMFGKGFFKLYVFVLCRSFDFLFLKNLVFEISFVSLEVFVIECGLVFGIFLNSFMVKYEKFFFFFRSYFNL